MDLWSLSLSLLWISASLFTSFSRLSTAAAFVSIHWRLSMWALRTFPARITNALPVCSSPLSYQSEPPGRWCPHFCCWSWDDQLSLSGLPPSYFFILENIGWICFFIVSTLYLPLELPVQILCQLIGPLSFPINRSTSRHSSLQWIYIKINYYSFRRRYGNTSEYRLVVYTRLTRVSNRIWWIRGQEI